MAAMDMSPEQLKAASNQMMDRNQEINTAMNKLLSDLEPLSAGWIGAAKNAFDTAKVNWHQVSQKHNKNLHGISVGLQESGKGAEQMEQQHTEDFGKIGNALQV